MPRGHFGAARKAPIDDDPELLLLLEDTGIGYGRCGPHTLCVGQRIRDPVKPQQIVYGEPGRKRAWRLTSGWWERAYRQSVGGAKSRPCCLTAWGQIGLVTCAHYCEHPVSFVLHSGRRFFVRGLIPGRAPHECCPSRRRLLLRHITRAFNREGGSQRAGPRARRFLCHSRLGNGRTASYERVHVWRAASRRAVRCSLRATIVLL